MAIVISGVMDYENDLEGNPELVDGVVIDFTNDSELIIEKSTVQILTMFVNTRFRTLRVNGNNTNPIFIRHAPATNSTLTGGGNFIFRGQYIDLPVADGVTPDITITLPQDLDGRDYPKVPFLLIDNVQWTCVSSLSNIRNDARGEHFTYSNGIVSFGDGVNGKIPSGAVQIPSIVWEFNECQFNASGSILDIEKTFIIDPDLRSGGTYRIRDSAIIDSTQAFTADSFSDSDIDNLVYIGLGTENTRLNLPRGDHGKIIFQTENTSSTEVVNNSSLLYYDIEELRCNFVTQKTNSFYPRVRPNCVGRIGTLKTFVGNSGVHRVYNEQGGEIENLIWSTTYKIGDTCPYWLVISQGLAVNHSISRFTRYGTEPWPSQMRHLVQAIGTDVHLANIVTPVGSTFYEVFNLNQTSSGSILNVEHNGTSERGARDINVYSQKQWLLANIVSNVDNDIGNIPCLNTQFLRTSIIGYDFSPAYGMYSSEIYKSLDKTLGSLVSHPFYNASDSKTSIINGSESDILHIGSRLHLGNTSVEVETESNIVSGTYAATSIELNGSQTSNFNIQFSIKTIAGTYSTYQDLTLSNWNAEIAAQGITNTSQWLFKIKVRRVAGTTSTSYLQGIFINCGFDPNYIWETPADELAINLPNIIDGTRVVVINYTRSTKIIDQYGAEIITVPSLIDNSIVSGGQGYTTSTFVGGTSTTQLGDVILVKANWQSGVEAKIPLRLFAVMTESGITLIESQEDDLIHNNMIIDGIVGFDGSLVDSSNGGELTANFTDVEINVNDVNDSFDCQKGIAWWRWINTTALGALYYDALGLAYVPDERNIEIRGRLKLKNNKPNSELVIFGGIWRHYKGEAIITTGASNASIQWVPNDRLYNSNSQQITQIAQTVSTIPTNPVLTTDSRLDYLDANVSDAGVSEVELHSALDSYTNKDSYKANPPSVTEIQNGLATQDSVDSIPTNPLLSNDIRLDTLAEVSDIPTVNEIQNGLSLETTSQSIKSDTELMVKYHDNNTRYIGQDGVTVVSTKEGAYFIVTYDNNGTTELKRVAIKDAEGNPINLGENAAGYDKV